MANTDPDSESGHGVGHPFTPNELQQTQVARAYNTDHAFIIERGGHAGTDTDGYHVQITIDQITMLCIIQLGKSRQTKLALEGSLHAHTSWPPHPCEKVFVRLPRYAW